ncbi:PhzF family phenazine biosynthesis isomerase [Microbacterium neimengense]
MSEIEHWTAFSDDPTGGNPAGVVRSAQGWSEERMQRTAADLGYAESAFATTDEGGVRRIRYFSPIAEVPFCGHATVATAAALAEREGDGRFVFETAVGGIEITTRSDDRGRIVSFTSVEPDAAELTPETLDELVALLGIDRDALHPSYPPALAYGGNWHPLLVLAERPVFDAFAFDPAAARHLLDANGWPATIIVLWPESDTQWHARNIFPVGTVTEDPATGAAAAATGGYLRSLGLAPRHVRIHQGAHVGRPSVLDVDVTETGGIVVSGRAARIR